MPSQREVGLAYRLRQPEMNILPYFPYVAGLNTTYGETHVSYDPHGINWTGDSDERVQSGWVSSNGTIGFMWNSAQSGDSSRPQPFVRILRLQASNDTSVVDQPDLWNRDYA